MTGQQLDLTAAFAVADEAIAGVEANAHPSWLEVARAIVWSLPSGREFTTDHVWEWLERSSVRTHEPRALGAVMREMQRKGQIVNTKQYQPSARRECHARPIPIWRRV